MKKYMLPILCCFFIIPILGIIYWDFFFQDSLNNPDFKSNWTWVLQPEITIDQQDDKINISWFVLRSPMMQFSHFTYLIAWSDIYISGYTRPIAILFSHSNQDLTITLKSGTYKIFYKNGDGSNIFIKNVTIK